MGVILARVLLLCRPAAAKLGDLENKQKCNDTRKRLCKPSEKESVKTCKIVLKCKKLCSKTGGTNINKNSVSLHLSF